MSTYIKPEKRKTILLIGDDLRASSGVGVMSRAIVYRTADHFNWVQIGVLTHHNDNNPTNISSLVNEEMGYKDSNVVIIPDTMHDRMYSSMETLRIAMRQYHPDAVMLFTDPHYYMWVFKNEMEIRSYCPLIYLNIWDNLPYPIWNKPFYQACDGLFAISKQTYNINVQLLADEIDKHIIKYIPHGVENTYYPLDSNSPVAVEFKNRIFNKYGEIPEFVLLFNARNMGRKNISDLILGWRDFTNTLPDEHAKKCCLLLHCAASDWSGTDLLAVWQDNCDTERCKIAFIEGGLSFQEMNLLYNISDGVILPSYAEGWGLSVTESLMTGKMFIATVTGGMQDQMRFEDENGQWINFSKDFPSNNIGKYTKHGEWCIPIFPSVGHSSGSPSTPYIYEDYVRIQDITKSISELYNLGAEERKKRGMKGYEWANSSEAGFTAQIMGDRVTKGIEEVLDNFEKKPNYRLVEVVKKDFSEINHNITWKN
jgi:glycosyltransferase involved in cell wall biosynthesis